MAVYTVFKIKIVYMYTVELSIQDPLIKGQPLYKGHLSYLQNSGFILS